MKRLLGLLLVMGMVGCGSGASEEGGGASEEKSLAALGASAYKIKRNELGEVVEMQIHLFSSNEKLVYVKGLAKLETLSLRDCRNITDAGLVHLKDLTNLQAISFMGVIGITDTGIVHLNEMANLDFLDLDETKASAGQKLHADKSLEIDDICKTLRLSRSTFYRYVRL